MLSLHLIYSFTAFAKAPKRIVGKCSFSAGISGKAFHERKDTNSMWVKEDGLFLTFLVVTPPNFGQFKSSKAKNPQA